MRSNLQKKLIIILIIACSLWFIHFLFTPSEKIKSIEFKGFGWYGYLADDELNNKSIQLIKELGGNAVNINVYYEYDPNTQKFILLSNLTKIEQKIKLAHENKLKVFLSPFANLLGGHYTGGSINETEEKSFLDGAENISINLAMIAQKDKVELYGVWNELGLAIHKLPNSANTTSEWLQDVRKKVRKIYNGLLTTKEGVQYDWYINYNFSGYDYIGVTFYPTTGYCVIAYNNTRYCGVKDMKEYENIVEKEFKNLVELKNKFKAKGIILGEIGIDVVGNKFIGNDKESKKVRAEAYEIILKNGIGKIDGFFFSEFKGLDEVFKRRFV